MQIDDDYMKEFYKDEDYEENEGEYAPCIEEYKYYHQLALDSGII